MGPKTYVIVAEPGKPPAFGLLGADGVSQTPVPAVSVPPRVAEQAAWLSSLADGRPLPPRAPAPVVFAPTHPGGAFIALVTIGGS